VDVGVVKGKKSVLLVPIINTDQHNKILVVYQSVAYIGLFVIPWILEISVQIKCKWWTKHLIFCYAESLRVGDCLVRMVTRLRTGRPSNLGSFLSRKKELFLHQTGKGRSGSWTKSACCVVGTGDTFLGVHGQEREDNFYTLL